jgi:hypothetical protein
MDEMKLAVIEEVVKRMESQNLASLANIQSVLNDVRDDFQSHLITAAVHEKRLLDVEGLTGQHQTTLHGERGVVKRVEALEQTIQGFQKVIWEIAKPGLGMLGGTLLVGIGIFAIVAYGLSVILDKLP